MPVVKDQIYEELMYNITYTSSYADGYATLVGTSPYSSGTMDIIVPKEIQYFPTPDKSYKIPVTSIGNGAFKNNQEINKVEI